MRTMLIAFAACCALVAGGCGSSVDERDRAISDRLGGSGDEDAQVVADFTQAMGPITDADIDSMRALTHEDTAAFEKGIGRIRAAAAAGAKVAERAKSVRLRDYLEGYAEAADGVADAYQHVLDRPDATVREIRVGMDSARGELQE